MTSTAVRVALRVRPLTQKEHLSNCTECITFIPDQPQILIGKDHSFTYDYVFDTNSQQENIYNTSVVSLVEKFIDGFNATILAYGQTGSGKTFSMGTALDENLNSEQQGIIPRFIFDLFDRLEKKKKELLVTDYQVYVSFLELYNEDFVDLLNASSQQFSRKRSNSVNNQTPEVQIREDVCGQIYWSGVREEPCSSPDDLLRYLTKGSFCRTTGSTDMNSVSSRSHAIFSVILKQKVPENNEGEDQVVPSSETQQESRTLVSKFHFVDLAGSERLKRTKAEGNRAREGISINSGLLALGNVISALGDESRRSTHVPYRDSKLTRLLQDSLGGNSQTLMMACVSPSDSNFLETLSTLKYANRAKNIKNKVAINQEFAGSSVEVNQLRAQVARLKLELNALRGSFSAAGDKNATKSSSDMMINNMLYNHETGGSTAAAKALKEEIDRLKARMRSMSDDICRITTERDSLQMERELAQHLNSPEWPNIMNQLQGTTSSEQSSLQTLPIISQYQKTIKDLREELSDTQERLAFSESIRAPLMQAMAIPPSAQTTPQSSFRTALQKQLSTTTNKRRGANKKRRTINGSNTTTARNVTFRSSKRSKVPNMTSKKANLDLLPTEHKQRASNEDDIEVWIQETIGSIQTSESTGLRLDAKASISNAKSQIEKALKVLDDFKSKEPEKVEYDCDILNDDELFMKLQSDDIQSLFGDVEESQNTVDKLSIENTTPSHMRMPSTDTGFSITDDQELIELCQSHPQLSQMLDQIQSDIQVNEDLMQQLEKTETEYSDMRKKFEKKLLSLRDEILELRQQQEQTSSNNSTYNLNHIRLAYEGKMKNLMNQLSELRRKYTQTSSTIQSSRNQNESMIRALRGNVETLKVEKRRMIKRMKEEAERVKEQMQTHEREIQLLRRKQSKDNDVRKRLERDVKQMQLIISKKTDESVVTAEKMKALVQILKKAVREGGVLDEKLIANCGSLLDIGSALVHSAKMGRISRSRHGNKRRQYNGVSVEERATKKKALLDNALYQFIQGKQAVEDMKQLLAKRSDLSQRKIEYMSERELLLFGQDNKDLSSIDHAFVRVIDENIETVEAEISYINARIQAIHNDAATEIMQEDEADEEVIDMSQKPTEKRVTFAENQMMNNRKTVASADDDNWLDMDALEERYGVPSSAGPEQSLEMIAKILKSMTKDETSHVMESVIDDIVLLRMEEHNNKLTIQQLEKSAQDLRRTLIVMKKAAIDTTIENEKKLKRLQQQQQQQQQTSSRRTSMTRELRRLSSHSSPTMEDSSDVDSAIDLLNDDNYQHVESMFEKIYNDGINGKAPTYEYGVSTSGVESISPVAIIENELSPYLRPESVAGNTNQYPKNNSVQAPIKPTGSPLACRRRDSMSSPEQFLQQLLQTPKDVRPPPSPLMRPSEFTRYQHERESSTSSVRTRSYTSFTRRSSLQSDNGSVPSLHSSQHSCSHQMRRASSGSRISSTEQNNAALPPSTNLNRRRAFSFQQPTPNNALPPTNLRRRSLLRELSNSSLNTAYESMAPTSPKSPLYQTNFDQDYSNNGTTLIPAFSTQHSSIAFTQSQQNIRPHSVLALHASSVPPPRPASKISAYPRKDSPNSSYELRKSIANNVFDRLSNNHTHASQAKQKANSLHRYSSSSIDDLRKQWASELSTTRVDY